MLLGMNVILPLGLMQPSAGVEARLSMYFVIKYQFRVNGVESSHSYISGLQPVTALAFWRGLSSSLHKYDHSIALVLIYTVVLLEKLFYGPVSSLLTHIARWVVTSNIFYGR